MRKKFFRNRSTFLPVFLAGFLMGVFYITIFGKTVIHETSLLSPYFFSKYQQIEFVTEELFIHTYKSRLTSFTVLWMTGLTVLGTACAYLYLCWLGAALGITFTTAALKMGIHGILLCLGSSLPHFVLYVPLVVWVLKKICEMSGEPELKRYPWRNEKRRLYAYLLVWLIGAASFLAGSFLESYVNPIFLKTFLKHL